MHSPSSHILPVFLFLTPLTLAGAPTINPTTQSEPNLPSTAEAAYLPLPLAPLALVSTPSDTGIFLSNDSTSSIHPRGAGVTATSGGINGATGSKRWEDSCNMDTICLLTSFPLDTDIYARDIWIWTLGVDGDTRCLAGLYVPSAAAASVEVASIHPRDFTSGRKGRQSQWKRGAPTLNTPDRENAPRNETIEKACRDNVFKPMVEGLRTADEGFTHASVNSILLPSEPVVPVEWKDGYSEYFATSDVGTAVNGASVRFVLMKAGGE